MHGTLIHHPFHSAIHIQLVTGNILATVNISPKQGHGDMHRQHRRFSLDLNAFDALLTLVHSL